MVPGDAQDAEKHEEPGPVVVRRAGIRLVSGCLLATLALAVIIAALLVERG